MVYGCLVDDGGGGWVYCGEYIGCKRVNKVWLGVLRVGVVIFFLERWYKKK